MTITIKMSKLKWKPYANCCLANFSKEDETNVPTETFGSSWRSISPLFWRVPIFLWSFVVIVMSMSKFWGPVGKFFIYMTNWGMLMIFFESLLGIIVTIKKADNKLTEATSYHPWYVKMYWVLYNITIPVSFLIAAFYWGILRSSANKASQYAPDPVLDVMLHGANAAVMLVELVSSAHPSRLLHVMQPLYFALGYTLFTVAYYFAGGTDPFGNPFVYPVLDWKKPDETIVVVAVTALFIALMHLVTVAIAALRDFIARRCSPEDEGKFNDGFVP